MAKLIIVWPLIFLLIIAGAGFAFGAILQISAVISAIILIYVFVRTCTDYAAPELAWFSWIMRWLAGQLDGVEAPTYVTSEATATVPKIYAYHPHGLYAVTPLVHVLRRDISAALVTVPFATNFPVVSILMKTLNIISSDKANLRSTLAAGGNIAILVGGIREAERTVANEMTLCADRKGIFEVAIETGAEIIPTLCYGENEIFRVWKPLGTIQDFMKRWMHFTIILPYMSDILNLVVKGCPEVKTYMGAPIRVADGETVDTLRAKYMAAFDELYAATRPVGTYKGERITWISGAGQSSADLGPRTHTSQTISGNM